MPDAELKRMLDWILDHVDRLRAPLTSEVIVGGRSNITLRVEDAAHRVVIARRPPHGHVLETAHDVVREHRIIEAVAKTDVPVPKPLAVCSDSSVCGAPFYVMSHVDGVVMNSVESAEALDLPARRAASFALVEVLADLHAIDPDAVGVGDLSRRESYVERQVRRWGRQWETSGAEMLPAMEEVRRRLQSWHPVQQRGSIVHGDFRFGNCLTDPATGKIRAVLDWELCTLGDPLADLGYLGVFWSDVEGVVLHRSDPTPAGGFASFREIVERYARRSGLRVDEIGRYVGFSCWRTAIIIGGVRARAQRAGAVTADDAALGSLIEQLLDRALAATR